MYDFHSLLTFKLNKSFFKSGQQQKQHEQPESIVSGAAGSANGASDATRNCF